MVGRLVTPVLLLLCLAGLGRAAGDGFVVEHTLATPLFAFSNAPVFGDKTRVAYEVVTDLQSTLRELISGLLEPAHHAASMFGFNTAQLAASQPDVVLTVLGSQLSSADLKRHADSSVLQPLQEMMAAAESSLAMPHVMHEVEQLESGIEATIASMMSDVAGSSHTYHVVGCGADSSVEGAVQLLQGGGQPGPVVMLVCNSAPAGDDYGVAAEMGVLQQLHSAIEQGDKKHVTLYAQQPAKELVQQRRRLMQAQRSVRGATAMACDELCQTQVKFLQGILAALLVAFACVCGLSCLNLLDTPTRFEKAKDARNE